ncbi:hypothetical protein B0F90DRAFT_1821170 [Multifurca ochricompacta]|uniref:Crinkler effector protein N-terminal domain-containing protein n=1 Tax=Multifurca ochricompacta TaxID=376703 RepID=A0AAD4QKN2_9AGAM|nr:hypothetical protein B0F90DRAFT_1821170 [Multifurca ochricompacta]
MAPMLTLFCLVIDNQKVPIGNAFKIQIRSDRDTSDLRKVIKNEMAPRLNHLAASELNILKLSTDPPINTASKNIFDEIKAIDFSSTNVQDLPSAEELFQHWENSPDRRHLHIIVQVPSVERPEKRRKIDDNQEWDDDAFFEAAKYLHSTIWNTSFDERVKTHYVPELRKSFKYLTTDSLSKLRLKDLDFMETVLMIRQEYDDALNVIKEISLNRETSRIGGIIITGQPGIGKTCFLFYLLLLRLSSGQPTAFQKRPTYYLLFTDSGVERHILESGALPVGTLALSDSNAQVEKPCNGFLYASNRGTAFVVQTTSPKADRWTGWEKYHNGFLYVMECFSWDEMHVLGTLLNLSVETLKNNYEKWGPSARTLIKMIRTPSFLEKHEGFVKRIADDFANDFRGYTKDINAMGACHRLIAIHPSGTSLEKRGVPIGEIATEHLNNLVLDARGGRTVEKQLEFYNLISSHKHFRGSAGFMFEMFVYASLSSKGHSTGEGLVCTAVHSNSPSLTIPVCGGWSPFTSNPEDVGDHETPFCLKPDAQNFPTADAIICTNEHVITIQATIADTHSAKVTGFYQVFDGLPPKYRNNRTWCHVFVTDKGGTAKNLRDQWRRKPITRLSVEGGENNLVVHFYSCVLNPAQDD